MNNHMTKMVLLISPSMFSVFLMHTHGLVLRHIKQWDDNVNNHIGCLPLSFLLVALFIFTSGLLLDIPRRIVGMFLKKCFEAKRPRHIMN